MWTLINGTKGHFSNPISNLFNKKEVSQEKLEFEKSLEIKRFYYRKVKKSKTR